MGLSAESGAETGDAAGGSPPGQAILAARNVDKSFGPVQVLHGVSLDLIPGEVHALVGENGAGKSTVMKLLSGYLRPDSGQVLLNGQSVTFASGSEAERHGIVLMHQELNLAEDLTVEESIFLGRELLRGWLLDKRRMRAHVAELLAAVKSTVPPTARIRSLSVSQKQMVEIAKATDHSARVLIMDEPTSALTQAETAILFALIRQLKAQGVAIGFVSHKLGEVKAIADRVTVLRDGHLVATRPATEVSEEQIAQLMVGRPLHHLYPDKRPPPPDAEIVMEATEVTVPGHVFGAGFTLRKGEILGFGGLVGSGRTELMEAVVGLGTRTGGRVVVSGRPLPPGSPAAAAAAGLAYLTEDRKQKGLLLRLPPRPNLTLSTLSRFMRGPFIETQAEDAALDRAVDRFELRLAGRDLPVTALSGGNQQKLLFAKVLEADPAIVIVDEPTRGVDVGTKQHIYRFIAALAAQGKSVIVVSSEMPELIGLCHRVVVMRYGRMAGSLAGNDITESEIVRYATGLKGAA